MKIDEEKVKEQLINELNQLRERVAQLKEAVVDHLTGLYSRPHFFDLAQHEFVRARRFTRPLSVIMLDIDELNYINESYGHSVGDQVISTVADRCKTNVRYVDILGRYGGEEFVILLPEADIEKAQQIAERVRRFVAKTPIPTQSGSITVTVSLGVADLTKDTPNMPALIDRIERAIHFAKQGGGDRVETA